MQFVSRASLFGPGLLFRGRGQVQRLIGKRSKTKSRPSASIKSDGGQWAIPVAGQICVRYPSIWLVSATAPLRTSCPQ
jgi:hypothetical protein